MGKHELSCCIYIAIPIVSARPSQLLLHTLMQDTQAVHMRSSLPTNILESLRAVGSERASRFCNTAREREAQLGSKKLLDVWAAYIGRFLNLLYTKDLKAEQHVSYPKWTSEKS